MSFLEQSIENCQSTGFCDRLCLFDKPRPKPPRLGHQAITTESSENSSGPVSPFVGGNYYVPTLEEIKAAHMLWVNDGDNDSWMAAVVSLSTFSGLLLILAVICLVSIRYYRVAILDRVYRSFFKWSERRHNQNIGSFSSSPSASCEPNLESSTFPEVVMEPLTNVEG